MQQGGEYPHRHRATSVKRLATTAQRDQPADEQQRHQPAQHGLGVRELPADGLAAEQPQVEGPEQGSDSEGGAADHSRLLYCADPWARRDAAVPADAATPMSTSTLPCEVLVVAVADEAYSYALEVAQRLRERGCAVAVDVRGRNVASNLRDAARRGVAYVAMVGVPERERGEVLWRDLAGREERRLKLDALLMEAL